MNKPVFVASAGIVLALAVWAMVAPSSAADNLAAAVGWTSAWFGSFYIALATVVFVFVVLLAASRYGEVRMGPDDSTPRFSTLTWASMLFAAGIGTDLMFFSVAEPVTQYLAPPTGKGGTPDAAREAVVWTLFHYGLTGWALYALMGTALAFFAHRLGMPLSIRSALHPLFGRRVDGALGHAVDTAAVLGTIFGVATTLGIGVVMLNYGLNFLFGVPEGRAAQVALIVVAVAMATLSAVSGVDKGIKRLSQLSAVLSVFLAGWILVTGDTGFLVSALVANTGDYVTGLVGLSTETFPYEQPVEWMAGWTLFFWAWWIAWTSFVGLFLARISRGRTIRQMVVGSLLIPFAYILMWVSVFGNSAIELVRSGAADFGEAAMNQPERGFYMLLSEYPAVSFTAAVATFVGLLYYVSSADSAALVMGNLTSYRSSPDDDSSAGMRIFWAVTTGLLTMAMLLVGGVPALQSATIIMGLPFAFVMVLVMVGLYKALQADRARAG
jgi:choline/glycine/proline betaine transport protein